MNQFISKALRWLREPKTRAQDQLIITTSTAVLSIEVTQTAQPGDAHILHRGSGLYYGLARDHHNDIWVAARGSRVSDERESEDETGQLINLSSDKRDLAIDPPHPLRDLHGLAFAHNALWLACSFDDAVAIYSLTDQSWIWWRPLPTEPDQGHDQFHFNTVWMEGDKVWVLAHRRGPSWLLAFPAQAALKGRTVKPLEKIVLGEQAHNLWRQPSGELCTCSSIEGVLVGERGWQLETGGFPRGIAQIGDGWVVGISELKERRERDFTDARLQFYNANWEKTGALCIPNVGMVLDMMTVSPNLLPASVGTLPVVAD